VFTNEWKKAWYAYDKLEVGGVVINDIPSVRVDAQPVRASRLCVLCECLCGVWF
jgi:acyl-CoA reductase-like NAD-dependent aldehyde dehydrogenase